MSDDDLARRYPDLAEQARQAQARLDALADQEPRSIRFLACGLCGALTGVEGGGIDNAEGHAEWHDRLEELLSVVSRVLIDTEAAVPEAGGVVMRADGRTEHRGMGVCNKGLRVHDGLCDYGNGI